MPRFMLYAHRNTAPKIWCNVKEKAGFPSFVLWIPRQKVYYLIELELTLDLRVFLLCFSWIWLHNDFKKPRIPSDSLDPDSSVKSVCNHLYVSAKKQTNQRQRKIQTSVRRNVKGIPFLLWQTYENWIMKKYVKISQRIFKSTSMYK